MLKKKNILFLLSISILSNHYNQEINNNKTEIQQENENYGICLKCIIIDHIRLLVSLQERQDFVFDDILYVKDGNIYAKRDLIDDRAVIHKDTCLMFGYELYYVLAELYWLIPTYQYFSYLEHNNEITANSPDSVLSMKINERRFNWVAPEGMSYNNYWGRSMIMAQNLIKWLQNRFLQ
jgi:hypothetical protein